MRERTESTAGAVDAHRLASQLLVLGVLGLAVPAALQLRAQGERVPDWWDATFVVVTLLAVGAALAGRARQAARVLWLVAVAGSLTLPAVVTGQLSGPSWLGVLSPVTIGACVLLSRRVLVSFGATAVLLGSGAVARQALVPESLRDTLLRLLALVAVWAVSLALLRTLEHTQQRVEGVQDAAVEEFVAARAAEATVRAEQAWDAYLHDEVVAALVVLADGSTSQARAQAERVLAEPWDLDRVTVPTPWVGAGSLDSVMRHRPGAETVIDIDPEVDSVPEDVRRALLEAVSEALRNIDRHAYGPGGEGPSRLEVVLDDRCVRMVVSDEGRGFEPRRVAESRLGIAVSIQARMDAVGGWARVDSEPGRGTRVELGWNRPEGVVTR